MSPSPLDLYKEHQKELETYRDLLIRWNQKINLTAITDPEEIKEFHFLDSLALATQITSEIVSRETISVLDMGSGNGLPGIAIKIACPDLEVTLVDSVKKKCDFMKTIIRELRLKNIHVVHHTLIENQNIGEFNLIISRATFKLKDLLRFSLPNLKPEGTIMAMKGLDIGQELKEADPMILTLGFERPEEAIYELPFSHQKRKILTFRQKCST